MSSHLNYEFGSLTSDHQQSDGIEDSPQITFEPGLIGFFQRPLIHIENLVRVARTFNFNWTDQGNYHIVGQRLNSKI